MYTAKKQKQFLIHTTHFRSVYIPKIRFLGIKAVHCSGTQLKKWRRKKNFFYFLNIYRYQISDIRAIYSEFFLNLMKNKSTLLKIRRKFFSSYILVIPEAEKFMHIFFIFSKIRGTADKSFRRIREKNGIGC